LIRLTFLESISRSSHATALLFAVFFWSFGYYLVIRLLQCWILSGNGPGLKLQHLPGLLADLVFFNYEFGNFTFKTLSIQEKCDRNNPDLGKR
jgi:hypothetical protein